MGWLFDLNIDISQEELPCPHLEELCGFRWKSDDPDFAFVKGSSVKKEERLKSSGLKPRLLLFFGAYH